MLPYAPSVLGRWSPENGDPRHLRVAGTLALVDISGFTRLTERLSRRGKVGAEEMSDVLDATFAALLQHAVEEGGDLLKWGGDAVLLLFDGPGHALRAVRATHRMRATLRQVGRIDTSSGVVVLQMSVGVHTGDVDLFLVGDPAHHRELLVAGPAATTTAAAQSAASAGQIGLSATTSALLPDRLLGRPLLDGRLLRGIPAPVPVVAPAPVAAGGGVAPTESLSAPLREHLSDPDGEAEHRGIAVAFVKFSGTDAVLERDGPGALADALDHVVGAVQRACAEHGVTFFESDVDRDGGKIMLTAGAPRSAEHLEERMLLVARHVVEAGGRLAVRIGVNRGHVFSGDFGPSFRRTYSVKGDAINLAARLLGRAEEGSVLATVSVLDHSRTAFATEELEPFAVKGKAGTVRAAVVGPPVGSRSDDDVDGPIVARESELGQLAGALADAREGRGGTLHVVGDAGIGKSRLVGEAAREPGVRALSTRCEAYQSVTAYYPFRKVLREALDLPADRTADLAAALHDRVWAVAPHLIPWGPLLGTVLELELPETPETAELDPRFRPARLEAVLVELLGAALPGPTVLVVEDAQHADAASAALVSRLGEAARERSWLLVVTRRDRPEDDPDDPVLGVGPLAEADAATLARQLLARQVPPGRALTPHVIATVARRSGGNPLFLGALLREAQLAGDGSDLPDSIESLVAGEVDRLAPDDRRALRYATVLGSVVDEEALGLLLAEHGGMGPERLHRLGRFLVRGQSGRLRFRDVLLRDVAYEGLPYRRRRALHQQVGAAIERSTEDPDALAETLSLHFFHAGDQERAWRYSVVAGTRAADQHSHAAASTFWGRAVAAVPRDGSVPPSQHAAVLERLADARFLLGDTVEASAAYAAARRLRADDPVAQALLVAKEVRIDVRRRRFPQAMRRLSEGLHRLEGVAGPEAEAARSLLTRRYAYNRYAQGRIDDALQWAEVAARHAEESADKTALAQAYEMLNGIYAGSGRPEPLPYGRLALQANRELGDLARQGHCLNNLAVEAFTHGRWDEALAQYREAADLFRRTGDAASEGNAAFNLAELLVRQGRHQEAADLLPEVLLVARGLEDHELVALALREQAQTVAAAGDPAGGLDLLARAREMFVDLGLEPELLVTDLVRAELVLRAGDVGAAGSLLDALASASGPEVATSARWHRLAAAVARRRGDLATARERLSRGLELVGDDGLEREGLRGELAEVERLSSR
ncbi:AAA family ATPase [Nocardioides aestuarii]|uniref:AAA family ATPase n=1 Tax=Nocardioides aestuarii TaxID=252231 RepID=A0ABW4TLQ1_9ACTN